MKWKCQTFSLGHYIALKRTEHQPLANTQGNRIHLVAENRALCWSQSVYLLQVEGPKCGATHAKPIRRYWVGWEDWNIGNHEVLFAILCCVYTQSDYGSARPHTGWALSIANETTCLLVSHMCECIGIRIKRIDFCEAGGKGDLTHSEGLCEDVKRGDAGWYRGPSVTGPGNTSGVDERTFLHAQPTLGSNTEFNPLQDGENCAISSIHLLFSTCNFLLIVSTEALSRSAALTGTQQPCLFPFSFTSVSTGETVFPPESD